MDSQRKKTFIGICYSQELLLAVTALYWLKSNKQYLAARYIRGKQYVIIFTNILLICVIYYYNWYNKHCQGICEQV